MMWNRFSKTNTKKRDSFAEEENNSKWGSKKRYRPKEVIEFTTSAQAYDCALDLLSYHDFSERRMAERLLKKGATKEQAAEAIAKLKHYGLMNEERYAKRVYESWLMKGAYGRQHLVAELAKRGVRADCSEQVLELFTPAVEAERAQAAVEAFCKRRARELASEEMDKRKLYAAGSRFLASRGFSGRYIAVLLDKLQKRD